MTKKIKIWSTEEKEYLKAIVSGKRYNEIVELMTEKFGYNFSRDQIKSAIGRYKLNTGFTGRFEKGSVPPNKGTKGISKANKTSFKKGQVCNNRREVGSERVNIYGYTEIKIAEPKKWALKHKIIWEQHHGPAKRGQVVIFADGDKSNLDINNLILITNKKLLILNRYKLIKNDAELTKTGLVIADIYQKITDIEASSRVK